MKTAVERERAARATREWYARNPEQKRKQALAKHGITIARFDELFELQHGRCQVCGIAMVKGTRAKNGACVDHCHTTGRVRALLCLVCNSGLGYFKDSPELLRSAAAYLEAQRKVM